MITALVQFKLPQPITREQAQTLFASTAPRYKNVQGLITVIATSATFTARPIVTNANGSFRFGNLPFGEYSLIAQMSLNGKMVAIGKQKVTIQSGDTITALITLSEVSQ